MENIRFDFVSDTAFREKVVESKHGIERALLNFLLRDEYWEGFLTKHRSLSFEEYDAQLKDPGLEPTQSTG